MSSPPEPRSQSRCLPVDQAKRLNGFWQCNRLTLTNVFQLAWALTLNHYTRSRDLCFGTIASGRDVPLPEIWHMVGTFFNVLPCRVGIDPERSVLNTLRMNQEEIQRRNEHQSCSIPDIVRESGVTGLNNQQQLFNTVLTVQNVFAAQTSMGKDGSDEIEIKLIELEDATEVSIICLKTEID